MSQPPSAPASLYNRRNPFLAELTSQEALTKPGSSKDTRHFVISLAGSGLRYTPGDSPALVEEVLQLTALDPAAPVTAKDSQGQPVSLPLRQALSEKFILNRATKKILPAIAERGSAIQRNIINALLTNEAELSAYLHTRDYVDILRTFNGVQWESADALIAQLSPIPPRLYSIASSLAAHPDEVHLCVAVVRYETHDRKKTGLCSGFLADHAPLKTRSIPIYVQESRHFRLPADGTKDIIMVGPGTGIAPFRAFLEQRAFDGARGRNWLFFGEQHRATEFFYEAEFTAFQKRGVLTRFDTAFSRDQAQKIYVQQRMQEQAKELWSWLQGGACFYVCGDAHRMAKDVHQALIDIAQTQGGMTPEAAAEYVNVRLGELHAASQ
jgi:sulfite reductase (NADPH) flavoprotein alpha-component